MMNNDICSLNHSNLAQKTTTGNIPRVFRKRNGTKGASTKDVGVVNIHDLISEAVECHSEDPQIEKFGFDLMTVFAVEDEQETNRKEIEDLKQREKLNTLNKLETDSQSSSKKKKKRISLKEIERVKNIEQKFISIRPDKDLSTVEKILKKTVSLNDVFKSTVSNANKEEEQKDNAEDEDMDAAFGNLEVQEDEEEI